MERWNTNSSNIAINGYDPVSYFTGNPVQGKPSITCSHDGATFHFANEANLKKFESSPSQYVPQFGGYCAIGIAEGKTIDIDPSIFTVTDDQLYLFSDTSAKSQWESKTTQWQPKAETNWSKGQLIAA